MTTEEQKRKKRKRVLKILVGLTGLLLLIGCCGIGGCWFLADVPDSTPAPATATEVVATVPPVATATPAASPTPSPTNMSQYKAEMHQLLGRYTQAQWIIADLNQQMVDDPHLLEDSSWITDMGLAFGQALVIGEEIRALSPPPEFEETHTCLVKSTRHYDAFIGLYSRAVDTLDVTLLVQAVEELDGAIEWMKKSAETMP